MIDPTQVIEVKDWYTCDIPRKELKGFMKKTNVHGLINIGSWILMLCLTGYLAYRLIGTFWAIPAFFLYGVIYCGCNSKWHECSHGTVFKTNWLNDFFYFVCGAMEFRDPVDFRWSHTRHHSYTLMTPVDPEILSKRPPKIHELVLGFFGVNGFFISFKTLILHSLGIPTKTVKQYVPEEEYGRLTWGARGVLALHLVAIGLSIGLQSWLPVLYFTLARCYGAFLQWIFIMTQHVGRPENVWDHRICARSTRVNPFLANLFMNMQYHVEHHIYPTVPFHALPKLHERIKDQLPKPHDGLMDAMKEIVSAVVKQLKDPQYSAIPELPEYAATPSVEN